MTNTESSNTIDNSLPIIYLLIIFSLPIIDMSYVIFKRIINKSNPFAADSTHLHHRLLLANFNYREIIFLVFSYTILSVFVSYLFLN